MYYQDDFSKVMYNETVFYEYLEEVEERPNGSVHQVGC